MENPCFPFQHQEAPGCRGVRTGGFVFPFLLSDYFSLLRILTPFLCYCFEPYQKHAYIYKNMMYFVREKIKMDNIFELKLVKQKLFVSLPYPNLICKYIPLYRVFIWNLDLWFVYYRGLFSVILAKTYGNIFVYLGHFGMFMLKKNIKKYKNRC